MQSDLTKRDSRKLFKVATLILLGFICCGALVWLVKRGEPSYKGRILSAWLRDLDDQKPGPANDEAIEAVKNIGTNALPIILRELRATDPPLKLKFVQLLAKQRLIKFRFTPAKLRQRRAVLACYQLGPEAKQVIPELVQILENGDHGYASAALARIGKDSVPFLVHSLRHTNATCRGTAANALSHFPSESESIVPALVKNLEDKDLGVRRMTVVALCRFETLPKIAVTALLKNAENETDAVVHDLILEALNRIDSEATKGKQK